jgi:N-methylhydantoinase B
MCQPNNSIPDVEINEQLYPVLFLWRGLYVDSGGPGTSRGGLGLDAAWIPWDTGTYMGTLNAACSAVAPRGTMGGYSPSTCGFWVARDANVFEEYFDKAVVPTRDELMPNAEAQRIKKLGLAVRAEGKDVFFYTLGGGSGLGDPLFRPTDVVAADVRDGYVSVKQARNAYGVVCDEQGTLDAAATDVRRKEIRDERLGREAKPITGDLNGGAPVHLYLQQVDGAVSCTQCGEKLSDELDWSTGAAERTRELSAAVAEYGANVAKHKDGELLLHERFCPGCATALEVTVRRRDVPDA